MPAPPMMGASLAQFVKNLRLEIMTLLFVSVRCRFDSFSYNQDKRCEKSEVDFFLRRIILKLPIVKLLVKYKGNVAGKSMGRNDG